MKYSYPFNGFNVYLKVKYYPNIFHGTTFTSHVNVSRAICRTNPIAHLTTRVLVSHATEQPGWHPQPSCVWRAPHFKFNLLFLVPSPCGRQSPHQGSSQIENADIYLCDYCFLFLQCYLTACTSTRCW